MSFTPIAPNDPITSAWGNSVQDSVSSIHDTVFVAAEYISIQAAIDAANTAGGGTVLIGPGIFDVQLTVYEGVHLQGAGREATILRVPNGTDGTAIKSDQFDTLTLTDDVSLGIGDFSIRHMSIDGNKANQTTTSSAIQVYGYAYMMEDVLVYDCKGPGIVSDWGTQPGPFGFRKSAAHINAVEIANGDSTGLDFMGPHDSTLLQVHAAKNAGDGQWFHRNANGTHVMNGHSWSGQAMGGYAYRLESNLLKLIGCQAENHHVAQILIDARRCQVNACDIYCFTGGIAADTAVGIQIGPNANQAMIWARTYALEIGVLEWLPGASGTHYIRLLDNSDPALLTLDEYILGDQPPAADVEIIAGFGATDAIGPTSTHVQPAQYPYVIQQPDAGVFLRDEFMGGTEVDGQIGEQGWDITVVGGSQMRPGEAGHPGIFRRTTTATAGVYAVTRLSNVEGPVFASDTFENLWIIRPQVLLDATMRLGFGNNSLNDPPVDGIYFERLAADTNWFVVTRAASVETRTDTGVAAVTDWTRFKIRRVDATTIGFSLNGGTEITHTTNIPSVALSPFTAISNNAAASNKFWDHDYFSLLVSGLVR